METKTRKAQVVLAAIDEVSHSFQILLLQTNQKRGLFWQNVTGKIDEGETFEEGGLREAIEETKLNIESIVDIVDLGLTYHFTDSRGRKVNEKCFLIILDKKWEITLDPHEHSAYKWVPVAEINDESVKYSSNFETLQKSISILRHWGV